MECGERATDNMRLIPISAYLPVCTLVNSEMNSTYISMFLSCPRALNVTVDGTFDWPYSDWLGGILNS